MLGPLLHVLNIDDLPTTRNTTQKPEFVFILLHILLAIYCRGDLDHYGAQTREVHTLISCYPPPPTLDNHFTNNNQTSVKACVTKIEHKFWSRRMDKESTFNNEQCHRIIGGINKFPERKGHCPAVLIGKYSWEQIMAQRRADQEDFLTNIIGC